VPVLVDPVLVDPVLVDPVSVPPEAVSVGFVLVPPPGPGELDVGEAGVEELLPGVDEDPVALGLALGGVAVVVGQGVGVAFADVLPFLALLLAFAEAVEVAVAVALADPVPVAVAVDVAVVVSLGPVLPLTVPSLDPLSVAPLGWPLAGLLAGVTLGVTDLADLAGLAAEDDGEPDTHAGVSLVLWVAGVLAWPAPPAPELYRVPAPLTLGAPLPVLELVIPTAELSWATASRSGGTASATPMANTTHAAARAGRSSPYRQSRCCRG
jgi:hypothetical protein